MYTNSSKKRWRDGLGKGCAVLVKKGEGDMAEITAGARVLRDTVYGCAVGDALGVPYEFLTRGTFECTGMRGFGTHNQPAGTWSDDSSMMLATCDSIRELGRIDTSDMLAKFRAWINNGAYAVDGRVFDYGGTTVAALSSGKGCDGERDNGNGSLMRIAPLAFTDATDDEVREVSAITHAHATSTEACVEFVRLVRLAAEDASAAKTQCEAEVGWELESSISSGGYVLDTLKAAKWCFANTGDYRECVLRAVNLGSDSDTTGAVAGALAGAAYGFDAIPSEWVEALRGKDIIESCLF